MVGFISNLAPFLNYLRRRSPGPPFPPDHRQAGERGAISHLQGPVFSPLGRPLTDSLGGIRSSSSARASCTEYVLSATVGKLAPVLGEVVEGEPLGKHVRRHGRGGHVCWREHSKLHALLAEHRTHGGGARVMHRRGIAGDEQFRRIRSSSSARAS